VDNELLRYRFLNKWDIDLNELETQYHWLSALPGYVTKKHESEKVICFERANCIFIFNFHASNSLTEYPVGIRQPGRYKIGLNSDDPIYEGHGRLDNDQIYFTSGGKMVDDQVQSITLYLPSRTCLVLVKIEEE